MNSQSALVKDARLKTDHAFLPTPEEIMPLARSLSDAQIDLIKRLIEFADENEFFESEFDDEQEKEIYQELKTTAEGLYEELSSSPDQAPIEPAEGALEQRITTESGKPWWDISEVRLGIPPDQLRAELREISQRLKTLVLHSDKSRRVTVHPGSGRGTRDR